jgi:peptidoglycan/LPS O-acetylase OafA/YrhL
MFVLALAFAVTFATAGAIYYWVERPAQRASSKIRYGG